MAGSIGMDLLAGRLSAHFRNGPRPGQGAQARGVRDLFVRFQNGGGIFTATTASGSVSNGPPGTSRNRAPESVPEPPVPGHVPSAGPANNARGSSRGGE